MYIKIKGDIMKQKLYIMSYEQKEKKLKKQNTLEQIEKIMSFSELKENLYYRYHPLARYNLCEQYHLLPENADIILETLYDINHDLPSINTKIDKLKEMKQYLEEKNLILRNELFNGYLKNVDIKVTAPITTPLERKMVRKLQKISHVTTLASSNSTSSIPSIYEFEYMEEEVVYVAEQITILLNKGVDINKIKLYPISSDYDPIIHKIFGFFQIPYDLNRKTPLIHLQMTQEFLKLLEVHNLKESLEILENEYSLSNPLNRKIYNHLITIINKYLDVAHYEPYLQYEFQITQITLHKWDNVVTTSNTLEDTDCYYFMLGLNQDNLPKTLQDEDYLSDYEKQMLELETSRETNYHFKEILKKQIMNCNHLTITYKLKSPFQEYIPSTIIEELGLTAEKGEYQFTCKKYNDYLVTQKLDALLKYNTKDPLIQKLYDPSIPYRTYQNNYQTVEKETLLNYLDHYLNLSYSSMDLFFRCQFRFYLNHILKIKDEWEETSSIIIGKLFHQILYEYYQKKEDLNQIIENVTTAYFKDRNLSAKDQFYIKKYHQEIYHLVQILEEQQAMSDFNPTALEQEFSYYIEDEMKIKIMGVVDKIMTFEDGINTYIMIIDYKTGKAHNDFNKITYGLDMQLLMYDYLIQKSQKWPNSQIAGLYLQPIIKEVLPSEKGKTYQDLRYDMAKLDGYTKQEYSLIKHMDHNVEEKTYLKSIRLKSDNTFYHYSKTLTEQQLQDLRHMVEQNIQKVINSIKKADFKINPKRFQKEKTNELTGCAYCTYYDICYKNPSNIQTLKEYKDLSFLRRENHDTEKAN